ncbi:MAG: plasmid replication/partition related protein [Paucibacter sp.]|nr:plasmid replication/partition related protein [Roseateles sp.]
MDIVVDEELKAYIAPLTAEEHESLERSILAEGCRDALVLWGNVLVDGHNRFGICQKHGLPFQTVQNPRFTSMEDVHLWMIDQHLGRRSVSDFQRGVLALRKREIVANRQRAARAAIQTPDETSVVVDAAELPPSGPVRLPESESLATREALARAARLSPSQVVMIEKIQKQAAPELVEAVRTGTISINAAAAVATLPAEQQVAAVVAGKDELKQAAKRVRETKRKPPAEKPEAPAATAPDERAESLGQQLAALKAENAALRQQLDNMRQALAAAGIAEPAAF